MPYKDLEKRRQARANWKKSNPDKVRAYIDKYYKSEKGKSAIERGKIAAAKRKAAYDALPEVIARREAYRIQLLEWEATKKERMRVASKRQRDAKKARDIAAGKVFRVYRLTDEEKKESRRIAKKNYDRRKKSAVGKLSAGIRKKLFALQHGCCAICKDKLVLSGERKYHLDHIVAIATGGTHTDDNVQLLCFDCNVSKGAKDPVDFMRSRGFLL